MSEENPRRQESVVTKTSPRSDGLVEARSTQMQAESPPNSPADPLVAPRLRAEQAELLRRYGVIRPTEAGQVLFREGGRGCDFIVILSGAKAGRPSICWCRGRTSAACG
jgi:hypothetical protein